MMDAKLVSHQINATLTSAAISQTMPSHAEGKDASHEQHVRLARNTSELQVITLQIERTSRAPNRSESYSVNNSEKSIIQDLNKQATNREKLIRVGRNVDHQATTREKRLFREDHNNTGKIYEHYKTENYGLNWSEQHDIADRTSVNSNDTDLQRQHKQLCLDQMPLFVAQNSICWYALSAGLSCYLLDLIMRKRRRSKSTIQLLNVRADSEGNLIELIFSNNHKRFTNWLPGQFVYLNCPQVANFEWHPFTISSMDNANRLFTLHIKTGGDWTRKLRTKLGLSLALGACDRGTSFRDSMSNLSLSAYKTLELVTKNDCKITMNSDCFRHETPILPDYIQCNKSGKPFVKCTKLIHSSNESENMLDYLNQAPKRVNEIQENLYTISVDPYHDENAHGSLFLDSLDLYIDGPFHSPFERLLEQPISVGIANGVGWTAFSSAFQCVTNELAIDSNKFSKDWWKRQYKQLYLNSSLSAKGAICEQAHSNKLRQTKLHLMVIVTSIEQLRPFYELALNYFDRINECTKSGQGDMVNPVKEITAFITRSDKNDKTVTDFCTRENLQRLEDGQFIKINETFRILLGKPDFEKFLRSLRAIYAEEKKISVYCCGSSQVKKVVRELCRDLNKTARRKGDCQDSPLYSYHEESF